MKKGERSFSKLFAITQIANLLLLVFSVSFLLSSAGFVSATASSTGTKSPGKLVKVEIEGTIYSTQPGTDTVFKYEGGGANLVKDADLIKTVRETAGTADVVSGAADAVDAAGAYDGVGSEGILGIEALGAGGLRTGHLVQGVNWAIAVVGVIQLVGNIAGLDREQTNAASVAAAAGLIAGKALYGQLVGAEIGGGEFFIGKFTNAQVFSAGVGIAVAVVVFAAMYRDESQKIVTFQCLPWEPPLGGNDCEKCNGDPNRPCSEYRCRSLGIACELVNPGTEEESCVWVNPQDVTAPTITPSDVVLTDGHSYTNHETLPTSLGTKIVRDGNDCIAPFTPLEFGIELNEPAQCKIDYVHTDSFEEMQYFFDGINYYRYEHSQSMRLPSPDSVDQEGLVVGAGGVYDLYVRCRDKNGNENVQEYSFNFCVDDSPDTTPPIIESTSIEDASPVAFGVGEVEMSLYVNEPAECRWALNDLEFSSMANEMQCATSVIDQNAQQVYPCTTTLTGVKDREINSYYFRCKDQPNKPDSERNENVQGYKFTLVGTQELNILDYSPNGLTIKDSTEVVGVDLTVETSNGASEGQSICYFSSSGDEGSYVTMFETDSFLHKQTLTLTEGNYEYFIRCIDAGGNFDEVSTQFSVDVDNSAPQVTRAYKEGPDALKIITDEVSECSYSLNNCNFVFEEGLNMLLLNPAVNNVFAAEWIDTQTYYIKCRDEFGNQPSPNECSIIASATNIA